MEMNKPGICVAVPHKEDRRQEPGRYDVVTALATDTASSLLPNISSTYNERGRTRRCGLSRLL